jgi:hypothetical protein
MEIINKRNFIFLFAIAFFLAAVMAMASWDDVKAFFAFAIVGWVLTAVGFEYDKRRRKKSYG